MRRLIIFRHAEAERWSDTGEDFDRPLTKQGLADARRIGRALAREGWSPDLALVSAARRTVQTWEAAAESFQAARAEVLPRLYQASPETLLREADSAGKGAGTVMLVAHNPGVHEAVLRLIRSEPRPASESARGAR